MFRFTLREVLCWTAIAAISLGWLLDNVRLAKAANTSKRFQQMALLARLSNAHFTSVLDAEFPNWKTKYPSLAVTDDEIARVAEEVRLEGFQD